jgi:hypothetical protein
MPQRTRGSQNSDAISLFYSAYQTLMPQPAFLDSKKPAQYGPRAFSGGGTGAKLKIQSGSKAWLTARKDRAIASNHRTMRPLSPRGSSVSANGSAG